MSQILGQITPVKAYQTTDGQKFIGDDAQDRAHAHQEALNRAKKERSTTGIPAKFLNVFDAHSTDTVYCGVTTILLNVSKRCVRVTHAGNMGAKVKDVIFNFERIFGKGSYKELRLAAKTTEVSGSPDYLYTKTFQF